MYAGRARHLREAADVLLHLFRGGHHEVGELVDDYDDVRQPVLRKNFLVVALEIAHADFREGRVAVLHLAYQPRERLHRLLRVCDGRRQQMRQLVVDRHLDALRVDQYHAQLLRRAFRAEANYAGVDEDALARTRRTRDEQMRQLLEADDDGVAVDRDAERQRQRELRMLKAVVLYDGAQRYAAPLRVRYLYADVGLARNRRFDAQARHSHRERDVVRERRDLADLYARRKLYAELYDRRANEYLCEVGLDSELFKRAHDFFAERARLLLVHFAVARFARAENFNRRRENPLLHAARAALFKIEVRVLYRRMQRRLSGLFQRFGVVVVYSLLVLLRLGGGVRRASAPQDGRRVVFIALRPLFVVIEIILVAVELRDVRRVVFIRFAVVYLVVLDVRLFLIFFRFAALFCAAAEFRQAEARE